MHLRRMLLELGITRACTMFHFPFRQPHPFTIPEEKCTVVANASFILTDGTTSDRFHAVNVRPLQIGYTVERQHGRRQKHTLEPHC